MLSVKRILGKEKAMRITDIPQIENLSIPEKILFIEDLWDSIASEDSTVPIPQSHIAELDRRLARHKPTAGTLLSLDGLRIRIDSRK